MGVVEVGKTSNPWIGPYPYRVALALQTPGWGFYTVRGGVDPGERCFYPRFVGVVDIWNEF